MVGLVQVQVAGGTPVSAAQSERVQRLAAGLLADTSGVFLLRKHPGELVLIFKGQEPQQLREEAEYLVAALVRQAEEAHCALRVGLGAAKPHLRELYHSLVEALSAIQTERGSGRSVEEGAVARRASLAERPDAGLRGEPDGAGTASSELLKVDQLAVSNFLRYGVKEEVDEFLAALIRPLSPAARRSLLIKNYLLMDIVVAAAQFVHELGGDVEVVAPDLRVVEELQTFIQSLEDILPPARSILLAALAFRDSHLNEPYAAMMRQVKQYLATHYGDPGLSLQEVARAINLSPSHFSMVFGQEAGTTFRSYLTDIRIGKARELLRATALRPSEIAVQVGYSDPHYFSFVFRKRIGRTPTEFRSQALGG
jgi:two-component system response regulator YesN